MKQAEPARIRQVPQKAKCHIGLRTLSVAQRTHVTVRMGPAFYSIRAQSRSV